MGLNIKNEEAHRLAAEVAELAGETLTEAVLVSLRERREKLKARNDNENEKLFLELMDIARSFRAELTGPLPDHGEFLYDERGLPK